jgi:glutamyl-tRNA reductase
VSVVVVGLSHRTVPLELLERMAVGDARLPKALSDLAARHFVSEAVILSTCHRIEVYVVAERFHGGVQDVRNSLSELAFVPPEEFNDHLYVYADEAAASHLFSVAAGLDSLLLGEGQILGPVRTAWQRAEAEGTVGPTLGTLFRRAVEVGKRARAETAIARGVTSLSKAAVAMARDRLGPLGGRKIVVLGTGEMGEGMAAAVAGAHDDGLDLVVANRTWDKAVALAAEVGGRAVAIETLPAELAGTDLLLSSAGAPGIVLEEADLATARLDSGERPLLVIDLGMPRNIDAHVADLPGVTLLDLADLRAFVEARLDERRKEVGRVRAVVAEELSRHSADVAAREVAPTVTALRHHAEAVRTAELDRHRARLAQLDDRQREAVEALTRGIVAKLLHDPTVRLKDAAGSPRGERLAGALRDLFDL